MMFDQKLISSMQNFNRFIHVLLALALGVACVMVIWEFGIIASNALSSGNAMSGFFHALGALFILWTLSTLISAEINYLQTGRVYVRVFIEVLIITVIREMIVQPVQVISSPSGSETGSDPIHYGLLLAALLVSGVVYKLTSDPHRADDPAIEG